MERAGDDCVDRSSEWVSMVAKVPPTENVDLQTTTFGSPDTAKLSLEELTGSVRAGEMRER